MSFTTRTVVGSILLLTAAVAVAHTSHTVTPAYAVDCQPVNDNCVNETTKTSAMIVDHTTVAGAATPTFPVEPDNSEDWEVTAFWEPAMACGLRTETATVTVTWSGTAWVVSNLIGTASIVNIAVCPVDSCNLGTPHAWKYKLIVDIEDQDITDGFNLEKVFYETVAVDDGDKIASCGESGAVSPLSQTNTGWDNPNDKWFSSRCNFSCSIVGGSMSIGYN